MKKCFKLIISSERETILAISLKKEEHTLIFPPKKCTQKINTVKRKNKKDFKKSLEILNDGKSIPKKPFLYKNSGILAKIVHFHSVQLLSHVRLFLTPWTAARQATPAITDSRGLLRLIASDSLMPSSHPILCVPFS